MIAHKLESACAL